MAHDNPSIEEGEGALRVLSPIFETIENLTGLVRDAKLNLDDAQALIWMRDESAATASMLMGEFRISRSKATRVMRRLADAGLVREFIDARDIRKCNYRLTNRGTNVVYELGKRVSPATLSEQFDAFKALRCAKAEVRDQVGDLTDTEQRIVIALGAKGPSATVGSLCRATHLDQPKASMAIRTLRQKGLLEAAGCTGDARLRAYALTPTGLEASHRMLASFSTLIQS